MYLYLDLFLSLLVGLPAGLLATYMIYRSIFGADWWKKDPSGRSRVSTGASLLTFICSLLLCTSLSLAVHYTLDYGFTGTAVKVMEQIPALNEPLDPPLQLNLCEEWYPGCAYEDQGILEK